jgi:hypothetical protein
MFKQSSVRNLLAAVFWDMKGVPVVEITQEGTTLTSEVYCEMVKKLHRVIQYKRRGMLPSCVVLLHDNARLHNSCLYLSIAGVFQLGVV